MTKTTYSQRAAGILAILADRPVAYHPKLATAIGVKETVFVCQLLYWDGRGSRGDGYIWKVQAEITEETGLSRYEQQTVRKNLKKRGILEEQLRGVPAKLHYRLNFDALAEAIDEAYPPNKDVEIPQPSSRKPSNPDRDVSTNKIAEISQTITEITSENTPQITPEKGISEKPKPDILDAMVLYGSKEESASWTVPAAAGGADDWVAAVEAFAELTGISPGLLTKSERREWSRVLERIGTARHVGPAVVVEVIRKVPDSEDNWRTFSKPHEIEAVLKKLIGQHLNGGIRGPRGMRGVKPISQQIAEYRAKMAGQEIIEGAWEVL